MKTKTTFDHCAPPIHEAMQAARHLLFKQNLREDRFEYIIGPRCQELTGYDVAELLDRSIQEADALIHPGDLERCSEARRHLLSQAPGTTLDVEFRMLRRDGEYKWFCAAVQPYHDCQGQPLGIVGALDNIHQRKQAEAALLRAKAELEEYVQGRTLELCGAKERVEAADKAKSQFLSNMSHELRTPLNGIIGMVQLVKSTDLTDEQREFLDLALSNAKALAVIVNDLLDLSSFEAGLVRPAKQCFDLRESLNSVFLHFLKAAICRDFVFNFSIADDIPRWCLGDASRIKQILVNIIDNAFKFTNRGAVSVSASLDCGSDGRGACPASTVGLLFRVKDTGIGIPKLRQQTIFESFGLGEDYLTKKYSGAGLGLSISKQLAEMLGGTIWVESELGQGSEFFIRLCCETCEPLGAAVRAPAQLDLADLGRPLKILYAEDEMTSRIFVARMLKRHGHEVAVVKDGLAALRMLEKRDFDIVLMDIQMPRLNGLDATRLIRDGKAPGVRPDIPIIALTAYSSESDRFSFLNAGVDDVVSKPFEDEALFQIIFRILNSRGAVAGAPENHVDPS